MHFLLTTLKVVYVLTTPMPELMEDDTVKATRRKEKWENDDYICRGHILNGWLNVGSLRAKNLALLGKWCWRFRKEGEVLWVKVIKSIYGDSGGLGGYIGGRGGSSKGEGVWNDIMKIGEEIDGLGLELTSSFLEVLGDCSDIRFWVDMWVDNRRLCDRFPRLYHLDRRKESNMIDKGSWVNGGWCWVWDWTRNIRGRVCKEFEDLMGVLQNVVVYNNCRDKWRWLLDEDGEFKVKMLTRLIEDKCLCLESDGQETTWNKLVPKKVNIFIWRALKIDSAMSVWGKNFSWWKVRSVNSFTIDEFFSSYGNDNVPKPISCLSHAVVWTTEYFVWKERNN
nr:RNA-directed DNA polymerase, eukaryota, reverse transcriptase zinc-binding domain protein [Tanacetum cinerariifolium]